MILARGGPDEMCTLRGWAYGGIWWPGLCVGGWLWVKGEVGGGNLRNG